MSIPILFIIPADDVAVLTNDHVLKVDRTATPPTLVISVTLPDMSAEELDESGIFGELGLPDTDENPFLEFEMRAHFSARPVLCERYATLIVESDDATLMQHFYDALDEGDETPSPLHNLDNYELFEWEFTETLSTDDEELIRLAATEPEDVE